MHANKEDQANLIQIKSRADFLKIQGSGRKWVSHGLIVQTAPNKDDIRRIGYTVSKKVDKSAVKRNRIKRRLRSVAADVLPQNAQNGHDYILVGRKETLTRPYESLCKDLKWCLSKMGLSHEDNT